VTPAKNRRQIHAAVEFAVFVCKITHETFGGEMNSSKLIRMLEDDGWYEVRVTGSHHHFKHAVKKGLVTVPHPKKDLPIGTVKSILKTAGL
jgi:predicted RNA binding protein YcfA (HicA-like mRNA interferase family)